MADHAINCQQGSAMPALFYFLLLSLFSTGCDGCRSNQADAYPENLSYPARTDWLVDQLPTQIPPGDDPAGDMDSPVKALNQIGGKSYDPATVPEAARTQLQRELTTIFGTPTHPQVEGNDLLPALTPENLAVGSRLFRRNCVQCHGLIGDGRGPTGPWIFPHPRDFRQAVFKFVSTEGTAARKANRADLHRTLAMGLSTTAMPAFNMLPEEDRDRLVDYVIYLSLRGKIEFTVLKQLAKHGDDAFDAEIPEVVRRLLTRELSEWKQAEERVIALNPPDMVADSPEFEASIRRGHALFVDAKGGGCISCHGNYGRAGQAQINSWGFRILPANLTEHKRKGGVTRDQLYRRIKGGIGPSNMPAPVGLSEAQLWDLTHFVQALPNPAKLPPDIRQIVYAAE